MATDDEKIQKAIVIALKYGGYDGSHHKDWVINQMLRILSGENYAQIAIDYEPEEGIAP